VPFPIAFHRSRASISASTTKSECREGYLGIGDSRARCPPEVNLLFPVLMPRERQRNDKSKSRNLSHPLALDADRSWPPCNSQAGLDDSHPKSKSTPTVPTSCRRISLLNAVEKCRQEFGWSMGPSPYQSLTLDFCAGVFEQPSTSTVPVLWSELMGGFFCFRRFQNTLLQGDSDRRRIGLKGGPARPSEKTPFACSVDVPSPSDSSGRAESSIHHARPGANRA